MVQNEHLIEIWVNGNKLDLESQESVNIRFNTVMFDPTKITSSQAEYSFEFEIPCTPNNNKVFDYANVLSKLNKFHQRYTAEVYADGSLIFTGSLIINKCHEGMYNVNLVSTKTKSLDDIFGDSMMSSIDWKVPFSGASTINSVNNTMNEDYCFPLVSYGAFQKSPVSDEYDIKEFTSKFDFDEYNNWYIEDFYPSPKVMTTLKKCFESKGYIVNGDAFVDPTLDNIYMSTNLADEQDPTYNLGNPNFGRVSITTTLLTTGTGYVQDLTYPYYKVAEYLFDSSSGNSLTIDGEDKFNFEKIQVYDMLKEGSVTLNQNPCYMYQSNENVIVIPADGFYKIHMKLVNGTLQGQGQEISHVVSGNTEKPTQYTSVAHLYSISPIIMKVIPEETENVTMTKDFATTTPLEIALVRNYDDNYELIKGKYNMEYMDGFQERQCFLDSECEGNNNYINYITCFPHEKVGRNYKEVRSGGIPTKGGDLLNGTYIENSSVYGFTYNDNELMAYDPVVSPCFICGFSSMGNQQGSGTTAVIKNGYSWSKLYSAKTDNLYKQQGYVNMFPNGAIARTKFNQNTYEYSPPSHISGTTSGSFSTIQGELYTCVRLNKGDVLQVLAVHRDYEDRFGENISYSTLQQVVLEIEAMSPKSYYELRQENFNYSSTTEFDVDLQLGNFFNKEKKMSEWVQNVLDAFNLEAIQDGNVVTISKAKKLNSGIITAVDVDDRVNRVDAESSMIEYPRSMAVKFKIDHDEWGFERSAVEAAGTETILDQDGWEKYADSGYTVIQLNDDTYVTKTSEKSLQFSYNWFDTFHWYEVNSAFTKVSDTSIDVRIPVISKFSYMIDGYDYEESMKHDGYGLAQRFWFKPQQTATYIWTRTDTPEKIWIYIPTKMYGDINISYKTTERCILSEYFNINAYLASNYVDLDVYLSSDEYNRIKNGALVKFDSDLYYPVELGGYDPSGNNETQLKIMKKVD